MTRRTLQEQLDREARQDIELQQHLAGVAACSILLLCIVAMGVAWLVLHWPFAWP